MDNLLYIYQHLPEHINPTAFQIGQFPIYWYSLGYLVGFIVVYCLLKYRMARGELNISKIPNSPLRQVKDEASKSQIPNKTQNPKPKTQNFIILDFIFYAIVGLLLGARLGYALFYNFSFYFHNPLAVISPVNAGGSYIGIHGMSYFGGVIGIIIAGIIFAKRHEVNFWQLADFAIPAIPAGYFFGRVGNFLNGELYGRATAKFWGMYFSADPESLLRHPSQLYEAFFEGLVLFAILWSFRNLKTSDVQLSRRPEDIRCPEGSLLLLYLFLYGSFRFFIEFFREPEGLILGFLTAGQIFSLLLIFTALAAFYYRKKMV